MAGAFGVRGAVKVQLSEYLESVESYVRSLEPPDPFIEYGPEDTRWRVLLGFAEIATRKVYSACVVNGEVCMHPELWRAMKEQHSELCDAHFVLSI
jgi:hypothetical protein